MICDHTRKTHIRIRAYYSSADHQDVPAHRIKLVVFTGYRKDGGTQRARVCPVDRWKTSRGLALKCEPQSGVAVASISSRSSIDLDST
eukprot:6172870-Pleurochrysis_carterae.AAC.4